ncbi:GldG family protein [Candidatus Poribacteria bacterium]|nr:GldG family protein [Candidatus Poribacteria bacterium]
METKWIKAGLKTNVLVMSLIATLIFILVNYLAYRHYKRFDWTQSSLYSLSDKTKNIANWINEPLKVIVFFQPGHPLYTSVENLLKEYTYINDKIEVEYVDPDKNVARVEMLSRKFNLQALNVIVFSYKNKHKIVSDSEVVELDFSGMQSGKLPSVKGFRGEEVFTSVILNLIQEKQNKIYFLADHGEHEFGSSENGTGLDLVVNKLKKENSIVEKLTLVDKKDIPADADVLVIAGATKAFSQAELDILDRYLKKGGRLFVSVDPMVSSGIEGLLKNWGVIIENNIVVDQTEKLQFADATNLYINNYSNHPIAKNMKSVATLYYLACSVELYLEGKDLDGMPIAQTGEAGWAKTDINDPSYKFDQEKDIKGPISIAVAIKDKQEKSMRLVVFGDSDFFIDKNIGIMGNSDIFINSINWLQSKEKLISIGPKTPQNIYLTLNSSQMENIFWFSVVGLPSISIIIGSFVLFKRRR